ncbi:ATP synthase F1 subunit delta [Anaerofustis stercorihominis]|uniref:ATP synthase subunit delta n=1 Tax=Anaerofustis stercorihominis DSM 17244 TaxID=445971 RepID=B1CAM1_9FIRM|nr:ATP synthase F1 subunit delta [Anaerofustis stercorihominis]EDS72494.1 ATP synthase F1, delta subunit [Anaerofustis stercorihominis DSM 17244]MCQ4795267.1 ATP synthase F1 subunit delta [Anaerofustis stercorihominis]
MSSASYRYAYSLSELCIEENMMEVVYKEFTDFYELLNKSEELYTLLSDETFKKEDKKRVIDNVFDKDDNIMLKNFLFLLVDKNRIGEIKLIYLDFKNLYLEHSGILNVEVKSANELSEELIGSLKNKLSDKFNKKIILSKSVDKNIIGGMILYINGKMIDLSVKNELDMIKRQLKETKIV